MPVFELEEFPVPVPVRRAPAEGPVHLCDSTGWVPEVPREDTTLCGWSGSLVTTGVLVEDVEPEAFCRRCLKAGAGDNRARRFLR